MRQVIGEVFGGPDHYRLTVRPIPSPAAKEVRIRVRAAALGYADILAAAGKHQLKPPLPFTPGTEFSGIVDAVSTEVADIAVGEPVIGISHTGALAEQIVVPVSAVRRKPAVLSFEEAACLRVDYLTAFHALVDRAGLAAGERLLVLGAAGGVGRAAVQIGKALGAHVIAGASTDAKRACAMEQGADVAIDYTQADWRETLRGYGRVDVVFDPVGGAVFDPAFRSLSWKGRYLVIGFASGTIPQLPVNLALVKGSGLLGVEVGRYLIEEPDAATRANDRIDDLAEAGAVRPLVGPVFPLAQFDDAMRAVGSGPLGKIVVLMND